MRTERADRIARDRVAVDELHEQFARIGRALANPHRVELLDLLAQGERSVELLATRASISVGLASAHLQALRRAGLEPTAGGGRPIDEPEVLPWIPAASVYFKDPDGHSLEFIAMLPEPPQPRMQRVMLSEWRKLHGAAQPANV